MRTVVKVIAVTAITLLFGGMGSPPAHAQQPWSALPGGCAGQGDNFYNGPPSSTYPVARFRVPGGAFAFNGFHDGNIAVYCNVDNPRISGVSTPRWNQLQVT
jgi:hypothetical protein